MKAGSLSIALEGLVVFTERLHRGDETPLAPAEKAARTRLLNRTCSWKDLERYGRVRGLDDESLINAVILALKLTKLVRPDSREIDSQATDVVVGDAEAGQGAS